MPELLNVYALPKLAASDELRDGTVVVVDVLRATTTITYALAVGAKEVFPCETIDEAHSIARKFDPSTCRLGGERDGKMIDRFDLDNSPESYTHESIGDKTLIFTTTNGTAAMARCHTAGEALLGSFVNMEALIDRLIGKPKIHIVCSGTNGQMSDDDLFCAGLIVTLLEQKGGIIYRQNAQAITAAEMWKAAFPLPMALDIKTLPQDLLAKKLTQTLGAKNLIRLGLEADIHAAAAISRFYMVPRLEPDEMRITIS
jgi:2-phosphosulfolactate phosphatase